MVGLCADESSEERLMAILDLNESRADVVVERLLLIELLSEATPPYCTNRKARAEDDWPVALGWRRPRPGRAKV